ncbi:MAG TPA: glycosyltransferase [Longimicrobiales bacterium]|nr:glycosyltransferase [Longimicrobiales bacterium]
MEGALRVVHTIARVVEADGGPSRTVSGLCSALAREGAIVELVTADADRSSLDLSVHRVEAVERAGRTYPRPRALARLLERRLAEPGPRVIHDHGIWLPSNHAVARVAAGTGAPRVVSPRGMLSCWALAHRKWKKRVAWWAFQRRDLESAGAVHATSDLEADEIRAAGIAAPIAVVPNGVELPPARTRRRVEPGGTRRFLFLSRIHPKKGLVNLVEAWGAARLEGWELVIAGPDEGGHRAEVERRARALPPGPPVRFRGSVSDGEKWEVYGDADVFVLPTLSENFGVVVAEALASGVPVITTRAAPWASLVERGCGWWMDLGVEPLVAAIREAAALTDDERGAMGSRGRRLVAERFAWPAVARRMISVYHWLAGDGGEPACVRRD